jgi:dihydroorotate dehydrogenase
MNARHLFLTLYRFGYEHLLRPLIFLRSPEAAHRDAMRLLAMLDGSKAECDSLRLLLQPHDFMSMIITPPEYSAFTCEAIPKLMLAAGFVKGRGFADEESALRAVEAGENIIPGWRAMPAMVGAVEFGSFTRYPRLGNSGAILWRDPATRSTQNRIGLRNPGARAAARFMARHSADFPWYIRYGINIAVSPGVSDEAQEIAEVYESMSLFLDAGLRPKWFTLNLSCPNTEDDPEGNQTAAHARALCSALLAHPQLGYTPLWIKIGPNLGAEQYAALMTVCAEVGVGAIIATNTLAQPVPYRSSNPHPLPPSPSGRRRIRGVLKPLALRERGWGEGYHAASAVLGSNRSLHTFALREKGQGVEGHLTAGVGGGRLHSHALDAVRHLAAARERFGAQVCIIGCGGVLDGVSARAMLAAGADALQYWSALVYRGPLAAAVMEMEIQDVG